MDRITCGNADCRLHRREAIATQTVDYTDEMARKLRKFAAQLELLKYHVKYTHTHISQKDSESFRELPTLGDSGGVRRACENLRESGGFRAFFRETCYPLLTPLNFFNSAGGVLSSET